MRLRTIALALALSCGLTTLAEAKRKPMVVKTHKFKAPKNKKFKARKFKAPKRKIKR